jgi:hypothetical protein
MSGEKMNRVETSYASFPTPVSAGSGSKGLEGNSENRFFTDFPKKPSILNQGEKPRFP